jgi:hypothetical protein
VAAVFMVLLNQVLHRSWLGWVQRGLLWLVFALTLLSGIHYIILTGERMKARQRES